MNTPLSFTVTVTGCKNCPNKTSYSDSWCRIGDGVVEQCIDLYQQNKDQLTNSCPMVTTTPKAYILQNSEDSHKKLSWVENDDCENIPLFTSPQALTPITAADVTDEMLELVHKHRLHSETEIIVAVFNSVAAHLVKHRSEAR